MIDESDEQVEHARVRRGRGQRAGLTLGRIVAVARTIPVEQLSMQAVADRLSVDRKALNHHIGGRDSLLKVLALDSFRGSFSIEELTESKDWSEACRSFARSFVSATIQAGPLIDYIEVDDGTSTWFLEVTEALFARLHEAGFDDVTAKRSMVLLTNFCFSHSRDVVGDRSGEQMRRIEMLRTGLQRAAPAAEDFPHLQRIGLSVTDTYGEDQFAFGLELLLDGMKARLSAG